MNEVQVSISTDFMRQYGLNTIFGIEEKARAVGEAIANHYNINGDSRIVNVSVSRGSSGFGASEIESQWFRVTYLNGKNKNVLRSKQGNFNDYAGFKRIYRAYEKGELAGMLA